MKNIINIVLYCVYTLVFALLLTLGVAGGRKSYSMQKCKGISIEIEDKDIRFTDADMIKKLIDREYGGYMGVPVRSIDLHKMEKVLESQAYLRSRQSYCTPDGILHIRISQQKPAVKIKDGNSLWYVSESGLIFSVGDDWCTEIPQINGPLVKNENWTACCSALGHFLKNHRKWDGKVEQIKCNAKGEIQLQLQDMDEVFLLGYPTGLKDKFGRIEKYMASISGTSDKKYESIDVRYDNQIVCR